MDDEERYDKKIEFDHELQEDISDEEMVELVKQAQREALERAKEKRGIKPKSPFPKWIFWLIALALFFNIVALLPQQFSIPAIEFLKTSAKLSKDEDIQTYKQSVAVIKAENSRGTGFVFTEEGDILTNYHVIEGNDTVTVSLPNLGFFHGTITETYPEIDLAVIKIEGENLPALTLKNEFTLHTSEKITFIGNPLNFLGIANEGTVLNYVQVRNKSLPVVMMNAPVYRGNSGSPVINEQGNVIGVVYATMKHEEEGKVGLFIPIQYFHEARK